MGRIIQGQVLASTALDRQGERLSRQDIQMLFEQWPEGLPCGVNHDLSQPPVCRTFNGRVEQQSNGELALKADVEVFDEEAFSRFGGFSIAFFRRRVCIGHGESSLEVDVNPRQFDFDGIVAAVANFCSQEHCCIDVRERVEKADLLTIAVVTIGVFVSGQTFAGFFNAAGAELFELLKARLRKDDPEGAIEVHFHLYPAPDRRVPVIVLTVDPQCAATDVRKVDGASLIQHVEARFGHLSIQKVVGRIRAEGVIELSHVTAADGRVLFDAATDPPAAS